MNAYLETSTYIDWAHPEVKNVAIQLAGNDTADDVIARRCFEFVRDEIRHCYDGNDDILTASASEVLHAGTGFCYAKSHLLAALLRANNIPAALCYQRLNGEHQATLHGLNAVHLEQHGWYRIDPRGNKLGVDSRFSPPAEHLAFTLKDGDEDIAGYWHKPAPSIVRLLTQYDSVSAARGHLPDALHDHQHHTGEFL